MPPSLIITLRLLHVVAGAIWFGAVIVVTFFLMPSIGALGPTGGQVMKQMADRKYPQFVMALMGLTLLSGFGLMYYQSAGGGLWFQSPTGRTISLGAALAIVASIFGVVMARPTMMKMQKVAADMAAAGGSQPALAEEMKRLQARMVLSTRIVAAMLTLAVAAMAVARYM